MHPHHVFMHGCNDAGYQYAWSARIMDRVNWLPINAMQPLHVVAENTSVACCFGMPRSDNMQLPQPDNFSARSRRRHATKMCGGYVLKRRRLIRLSSYIATLSPLYVVDCSLKTSTGAVLRRCLSFSNLYVDSLSCSSSSIYSVDRFILFIKQHTLA